MNSIKQYPGVRYRVDGLPLNDFERLAHNGKEAREEILSSMMELKYLLRDVKILLQREGRH